MITMSWATPEKKTTGEKPQGGGGEQSGIDSEKTGNSGKTKWVSAVPNRKRSEQKKGGKTTELGYKRRKGFNGGKTKGLIEKLKKNGANERRGRKSYVKRKKGGAGKKKKKGAKDKVNGKHRDAGGLKTTAGFYLGGVSVGRGIEAKGRRKKKNYGQQAKEGLVGG